MNLKNIKDAAPKRNWKSTLTGGLTEGKPTKQQAQEFESAIKQLAPKMISIGLAKIKGNNCLGAKITPIKGIKLPSGVELPMIGTKDTDDGLILYFRPTEGWKEVSAAEELK